jgi:hypothetical protein
MDHGMVGCEELAEVEQLDAVFGIVTNYTAGFSSNAKMNES